MIKKVFFTDEYCQSKKMFFEMADLDTLPDKRIVPLFGPNGAGKTTFLKAVSFTLERTMQLSYLIGKEMNDEDAKVFFKKDFDRNVKEKGCGVEMDAAPFTFFSWSNSDDNFRHRKDRNMLDPFNPVLLNAKFDAMSVSEGQSIIYSIQGLFDAINLYTKEADLIVLIDELDSGISIDNLDTLMRKIRNILKKKDNIQIFMSFNNPRVLKYFPYVLSMYDGKVLEMHSDDDMLEEIRKNKTWFDKARKKSNGFPKVFD